MGRKPARLLRRLRLAAAVGSWLTSAALAQALAGPDIGRGAKRLEERIELLLRTGKAPLPPARGADRPESGHHDTLQPWELVSV